MELFSIFGRFALKGADDAKREIDNVTGHAEGSSGKITGAFKKIGSAVVTYLAVDTIKNFGVSCIQAAADAGAMEAQFASVFSGMDKEASASLSSISKNAGVSENRMKGSFTKIASFAKTTGMSTADSLALSERAMVAVADSAAFYDRSLEETTESLQSFLKGNYENDAALGLSCTETTRNAAANKLYGKSFKDLSESQKQLVLLQMVEDANAASGALGQAARESDTWTNQLGNLNQSWTDFKAALAEPVLEYVTSAVGWLAGKVGDLTQKFINGKNPVQGLIDKIVSLKSWFETIAAYASETFSPILDDIGTLFTTVKDALQPLIDAIVDYCTNGQLLADVTTIIQGTLDLISSAYTTVKDLVLGIVQGFKDAVTWGREHETALTLIGIALGTVTAAIVAYNVAMAIKNAGGIVELAQLGLTAAGYYALTAAQAAQTLATNIATAATSAFGAVMAFVTSPITLVVLAIGALIAIGVLLYKNWDVIKEKCAELWSSVTTWFSNMKTSVVNTVSALWSSVTSWFGNLKNSAVSAVTGLWSSVTSKFTSLKNSVVNLASNIWSNVTSKFTSLKNSVVGIFETVKTSITNKITSAKNTVKGIVDSIVGFFTGAKFTWPSIPMPHFGISPQGWKIGDLLEGKIPKLSIDWYAKAMDAPIIMDAPTIFGYDPTTGKLMGGGETGSEVVTGTDTLMQMIGSVVAATSAAQNERLVAALQALLEAITGGNQEIVKALLAGQTIVLDNREFARAVRTYA